MEIQTRARVKIWGNSLGIVIPKEIALQEDLEEDDIVDVTITKKNTLRNLFGKGKEIKIDSQKMKDEGRKTWKMD